MRHRPVRVVLVAMLTCVAVVLQPIPIPPFMGDGNPQHDGQPMFCQRHDSKYKANCKKCERRCENGEETEDSRCATNCRRGTCECHPPCQT